MASKKVEDVIAKLNKEHGTGTVMIMENPPEIEVDVISSGSISLDNATGIGGFPRGRVVEIYGAESSGKTTIALHAVAEAQKAYPDLNAGIIDAEHALDLYYASCIGVDTQKLIMSQPDSGEEGLEVLEALVRSEEMSIVVVDSVAALTPKAEIEGAMGDAKVGLHARLMSQAMRKITSVVSKSNTLVIFINQTREKVGVTFGSPIVTTGGNALKFYATIRLDVNRSGQQKDGEVVTANKTKVKVVKNKLAPPHRIALFDIKFGIGIHKSSELLELGVEYDLIEKKGAWFAYNGTNIGQGREASMNILDDNPELADEIEGKIRDYGNEPEAE